MISGILYQLISMFSFGTGNVLWQLPQKSFSVFKIITLRTSISVLLMGVIAIIQFEIKGTTEDWLIAVLISAVSFLGLAFYNMSIKHSSVSHSITITSTSAFFGVLTAILAYDEVLTWELLMSLFLIVIGLFLLEGKTPIINWSRGTFYALLASLFWGTTFALFRIPVNNIGEANFSFILELTVLICAFLIMLFQNKTTATHEPTIKTYLTIASIGILGFIGVVFYNKAVQVVDISTLSVMGTFTTVISIIIAHIILKERFRISQYIGMGLTVLAVLLLII